MKKIVEHLSDVIIAVAAVALLIGVLLMFHGSIQEFYTGVLDKMDGSVSDNGENNEDVGPQTLASPSISLTDDKLLITTVSNATNYLVYIDGSLAATVTTTTVDLSTFDLGVGNHSITVAARADGYNTSRESNSVIYTVSGSSSVDTTLATPSISLVGNTLTIMAVENATSYAVYVDGIATTVTAATTFDLSTLNFTDGSYTITVQAQASGYNPSAVSNSVTYVVTGSVQPSTLDTPVISLSGDILTITPVENATSYDIYADGVAKYTVAATTFNLYTLGLEDGSYTITVKAKADGYETSAASNGVAYVAAAAVDASGKINGTWDDIINSIEDGSYSYKYAVGNYMPLTLSDGTVLNMQIAAIDGDVMTGTNGATAPLTFISEEILAVMKLDKNGGTSWPDVDVRDYLLNTVWPNIPAEIQDAIVAVDKTYCDRSGATLTSTGPTAINSESLWIPSYRELGFGVSYEDSGVIYSELFTDDNSRVKRFEGVATPWWTRTIKTTSATWNVTSTGSSAASTTHVTMPGVVLGFCLGSRITLETPTVTYSAEDETLTVSSVDCATNYEVYKDGELFLTFDTAPIVVDLRDVGLCYGTYEFTVVATALGINSSAETAPLSYKFIPGAGLSPANSGFTDDEGDWFYLVANNIIKVTDTTFVRMYTDTSNEEPEGDLWISDEITTIGDNALSGRTLITAVGIPSSVTSIGAYVFGGCDSLTTIVYDGTMEQWNAIEIDSAWNKTFLGGTTNVTIKCTDGTITE